MNPYEQRLADQKARLLAKARRLEGEGKARTDRANALADCMNGTPVLVGHHSERRHRRDIDRMHNDLRKGIAAGEEAAALRARAAHLGEHGISSDDPEAVTKLKTRIAGLEARRARMRAVNAAWRAHGRPGTGPLSDDAGPTLTGQRWAAVAADVGLSSAETAEILRSMTICSWNPEPYPPFELTNLGANLRRLKERVETLSAETQRRPQDLTIGSWTITEEDRLCLRSPTKPPETVRDALKAQGFRWSPTRTAWVRQNTEAARLAARTILERVAALAKETT